ncbi:unnamed protein product [Closterium sp. Naga37s-1]|nr:unnamed protein product [Closterium sp. Naga37s-1]
MLTIVRSSSITSPHQQPQTPTILLPLHARISREGNPRLFCCSSTHPRIRVPDASSVIPGVSDASNPHTSSPSNGAHATWRIPEVPHETASEPRTSRRSLLRLPLVLLLPPLSTLLPSPFPLITDAEAAETAAANSSSSSSRGGAFTEVEGGVQVADIRQGTGAMPVDGQTVAVHYYARLGAKQGWRFDNTLEHRDASGEAIPYEFVVGSPKVIQGLSIAVQGMRVGGVRRAIIPPNVSYQTREDLPLPPRYSDRQRLFTTVFNPTRLANGEGSSLGTVIFDIQLLGIRSPL